MKTEVLSTEGYSSLLIKYKNGADVDPKDIPKLDTLASIGLIKKGMSIKRKKLTAKTTPTGRGLTSGWIGQLFG